jgi:RNA polymerase sigma factor (sigma-70 family)
VLVAFRTRWVHLGRRRYPQLGDNLEDAVQTALMKLVSRDKLATLHEVQRLDAWSRSLFVRTVLDQLRATRRHSASRPDGGTPEDNEEAALRHSSSSTNPTPEDLVLHRERLSIVSRVTAGLEVARAKFVEDLPEKEIARRQNLTRSSVASRLKRTRKLLLQALDYPQSPRRRRASPPS